MNGFLAKEHHAITKLNVFFTEQGLYKPYHSNRLMHGLVIRVSGSRKYIFDDGTEYIHNKNEIIFLPKGSTYAVKPNPDNEDAICYAINFDITDNETFDHFYIKPKNSKELLNTFRDAYLNWISKKPGYYNMCLKDLYSIIATLQSETSREYIPSSKEKIIYPAIQYINEHLTDEAISISHLSSICKISEVYFRKIFKLIYGTSPIKYINNLKVERAEEMLTSDMYTVGEISDILGYSSPACFSKDFKKYTGFSPMNYISRREL